MRLVRPATSREGIFRCSGYWLLLEGILIGIYGTAAAAAPEAIGRDNNPVAIRFTGALFACVLAAPFLFSGKKLIGETALKLLDRFWLLTASIVNGLAAIYLIAFPSVPDSLLSFIFVFLATITTRGCVSRA